jgi:hypothetical protein
METAMNKYTSDYFDHLDLPIGKTAAGKKSEIETAHDVAARDEELSGLWSQLFDDANP